MALFRDRAQRLVLFLLLFHFASADVAFTDLPGVYTRQKGNLNICTLSNTVEIGTSGSTLTAKDMIFEGVTCSFISIQLSQTSGYPGWTRKQKEDTGLVIGGVGSLWCGAELLSQVGVVFARPKRNVFFPVKNFATPYEYLRGVRYLSLATTAGECVYQRGSADPSQTASSRDETGDGTTTGTQTQSIAPSPTPTSSRSPGAAKQSDGTQSPNSRTSVGSTNADSGAGSDNAKQENNGLNMWVWLGPCIGAAATVVAALITVFKCTRRDETGHRTFIGARAPSPPPPLYNSPPTYNP